MKKEIVLNDEKIIIESVIKNDEGVSFSFNGKDYAFNLVEKGDFETLFENSNGKRERVYSCGKNYSLHGKDFSLESARSLQKKKKGAAEGGLNSPMPGKILKVLASVGDKVSAGDILVVMEAMKMEHSLKAPNDGVVEKVHCKEGEQVDGGLELVVLGE